MTTQKEFTKKVYTFYKLEDARSDIESMAYHLIKKGLEIEAYLLILATWNFANFRYILTNFDMKEFKETIKQVNPVFNRIKKEKFETANFDKLKRDISFVFNKLKRLVKQTGAAKIMYFKNPNLFVMWDINIRRYWKIPQVRTSAEDYIRFLKLMREKFSNIRWKNKKISFARAIDMYNFSITQTKIRKKRKSK